MKRSLSLVVGDWIRDGRKPVAPVLGEVKTGQLACPSYPAWGDSESFAYRTLDGLLQSCQADGVPSFRDRGNIRAFGPCITTRCANWAGHCNLGAVLTQSVGGVNHRNSEGAAFVEACRIQTSCRWKAENGPLACQACVNVDFYEFI